MTFFNYNNRHHSPQNAADRLVAERNAEILKKYEDAREAFAGGDMEAVKDVFSDPKINKPAAMKREAVTEARNRLMKRRQQAVRAHQNKRKVEQAIKVHNEAKFREILARRIKEGLQDE